MKIKVIKNFIRVNKIKYKVSKIKLVVCFLGKILNLICCTNMQIFKFNKLKKNTIFFVLINSLPDLILTIYKFSLKDFYKRIYLLTKLIMIQTFIPSSNTLFKYVVFLKQDNVLY